MPFQSFSEVILQNCFHFLIEAGSQARNQASKQASKPGGNRKGNRGIARRAAAAAVALVALMLKEEWLCDLRFGRLSSKGFSLDSFDSIDNQLEQKIRLQNRLIVRTVAKFSSKIDYEP